MSRSYRKPYIKDGYKCGCNGRGRKREAKRMASKAIRNTDAEIANGGAYKKHYCSWNICDYEWYEPDNEKIKRK